MMYAADIQSLPSHLKLALWLDEMSLPFDEGLAIASRLGVEYVWFAQVPGQPPIGEMTDAQVDDMAAKVERHA